MIYRSGKFINKPIEPGSPFQFLTGVIIKWCYLVLKQNSSISFFSLLRLVLFLLKGIEEHSKKCIQKSLKFHLVTFVPVISIIQGTWNIICHYVLYSQSSHLNFSILFTKIQQILPIFFDKLDLRNSMSA